MGYAPSTAPVSKTYYKKAVRLNFTLLQKYFILLGLLRQKMFKLNFTRQDQIFGIIGRYADSTSTLSVFGFYFSYCPFARSDRKLRSKQKLSHKTDAMVGGCAGLSAREHFVPRIVTACVDEIERRGLREVGVYRICGANSDIQTLTTLFNQGKQMPYTRKRPTMGFPFNNSQMLLSPLLQLADSVVPVYRFCILGPYFRFNQ